MTTETVNPVAIFDELAKDSDERVVALCAEAGLPPVTQHIVLENWQAVRTAMREAVGRWRPRPPLESATELDQLAALLRDMIDDEMRVQADIFIAQHKRNSNRTYGKLTDWNHKRLERIDRPSPEDIAAMSESGGTFDTFTYETDEEGNRYVRYRIKPSSEDIEAWNKAEKKRGNKR